MTSTPDCAALDCAAAMRQLWDYLDGELSPERVAAIEAHLGGCRRCHPHAEFERELLAAVAGARREHSDLGALRERVLVALGGAGFDPSALGRR